MKRKVDFDTSPSYLEELCKEWLSTQGHEPCTFHSSFSGPKEKTTGELHVLLMGDFLGALSKAETFHPTQKIKFWFLGQASLRTANAFFDLGDGAGIIPRYEIFPRLSQERPFPGTQEKWSMVFAGRLSCSKNIEQLLRVCSSLQMDFHEDVGLHLIGDWDDYSPQFPARIKRWKTHKNYIKHLISTLPWKIKPQIHASRGRDEWTNISFPNPVYVGLSDYYMDDFGVSVAQAQAKGWPCVLSDMGGHQDVAGKNVIKVPSPFLYRSDLSEDGMNGLAWAIAKLIHSRRMTKTPKVPVKVPSKSIAFSEIIKKAEQLKKQYDYDFSQLIYQDPSFLSSSRGKHFLAYYKKIWNKAPDDISTTAIAILDRNQSWASHNEILPDIEKVWAATVSTKNRVFFVPATTTMEKSDFMELVRADKLVLPILNEFSVPFLKRVRELFGKELPVYFYSLDLASLGGKAFCYLGLMKFIDSKDVFLASCKRDLLLLKKNFLNANVALMHLKLAPTNKAISPLKKRKNIWVYAGRISEQKNLHTMIWGLRLYKELTNDQTFEVRLYGKEDNLGSPFVRKNGKNYLLYLQKLVEDLDLEKHVKFMGHFSPTVLEAELEKLPYVFLSTSLHSDEDFGIAAFKSLASGRKAILSDWGGHSDYKKNFPDRVEALPVYKTDFGPVINPFDLANALVKTAKRSDFRFLQMTPYNLEEYLKRIKKIKKIKTGRPLKLTSKAAKVFLNRGLFQGYDDQLLNYFFEPYGMVKKIEARNKDIQLAPWCQYDKDSGEVRALDPHRGQIITSSEKILSSGLGFSQKSRK